MVGRRRTDLCSAWSGGIGSKCNRGRGRGIVAEAIAKKIPTWKSWRKITSGIRKRRDRDVSDGLTISHSDYRGQYRLRQGRRMVWLSPNDCRSRFGFWPMVRQSHESWKNGGKNDRRYLRETLRSRFIS